MNREEFYRITIREELKRICEVMAEMLSVYIRVKGQKGLNRMQRSQVNAVERFFDALAGNVQSASVFLDNDIFTKGLKTYHYIKARKGSDPRARLKYKEFLKSFSRVHREWTLEWLN